MPLSDYRIPHGMSACTNRRSAHPLEKYSWKQKIQHNFSEKSTVQRSQQIFAVKDYITRFLTDENQNGPDRSVQICCKCIKIIQLKQNSRAGAPENQELRRYYHGKFNPSQHSSLLSCLSRLCSRNGLCFGCPNYRKNTRFSALSTTFPS